MNREPRASALELRLAEARAAWPGVELPDEVFVPHLVDKLPDNAGGADPFDLVRVPELFLACACARGDAAAIAHFEREYFSEIDTAWARAHGLPLTLEDVRQRVREKLYLHTPPALASYAGRGHLRGFLRAAVLNLLVNISSRETREQPTDAGFFDAIVDEGQGSESAYIKESCRAEFQEAFAGALGRLTDREKSLLRYAFVDGLGVDAIGAIFRVHRATAARWVDKARIHLVAETRADLMNRLQIGDRDAESIVRAALSRMGVTLLREGL